MGGRLRLAERVRTPSAPPSGRVVVGYPTGGSVTVPFHASMLRLLAHEIVKPERHRLLAKTTHTMGLYVADNRTLLAQRFLESSSTWLLQIDTDIEFPSTLLETLLAMAGTEKKILAASVPLGEAFPTSAFMLSDEPGVWDAVRHVPLEPMECDGIATAVVLTHREVFEQIADRHGQCWFHHLYLPQSPAGTPPRLVKFMSQGEDLAFSVRAKRCGFKIWCAHVPGIRHHKSKGLSHDYERARALASEDSAMGELVMEA